MKGEENVYGMMGLAGKNIEAGEIKDFQVPLPGGGTSRERVGFLVPWQQTWSLEH
jgi:hypothetical protein